MRRQTIHKAVVSLLSGGATLAAVIWPEFTGLSEEVIVSIGTLVTTALVYMVPNQEKPE